MLDEYKKICKDTATLGLPGWEKMSKNELCHLYITWEHDDYKANACFSALLYKYWSLIPKYYSLSSNVAEPEDVYNWLVDSISYALKHRRWNDKDSHIYKDIAGPDKVINRRMKCARLTYYQFINRKKRKQDFELLSIEQLQEEHSDNIDLNIDELEVDEMFLDIKGFIQEIFNRKDYFLAFLLDIFLTDNIFDNTSPQAFNYKKVIKDLKNIDDNYCKRFAYQYNLTEAEVLGTLKYFKKNSTSYLQQKIEYYLTQLFHNKVFKEVLSVN